MLKGRRKKILSVVLCVVMVFTGIQLPQWSSSVRAADVDVEALDELPATGTLDKDSYKISSLASLKVLAARVNGTDGFESDGMEGKTFYLANDIAINEGTVSAGSNLENWPGIGFYNESVGEVYFYGTFDGMGHTISGLYINDSSVECAGLFGLIDGNAVIKNLYVTNAYVKAGSFAGIIVGDSECSDFSVKNCVVSGTVEADSYCGGIAGTGKVSNCAVVNSTIKADSTYAGGVCPSNDICKYCVVYETSVVSSNAGSTSIISGAANNCYVSSGCAIRDTSGSTISIDTDKINVYSLAEFKNGTVRDAINSKLSVDTSYADIEWTQNAGVDNYPVPSTKEPEWTDINVDENYSFSGGNGSKSNPYLIATDYDLAMLSKNVNNGNNYVDTYFKMTKDIDLNAQLVCGNTDGSNINKLPYCETTEYLWEPIGKAGKYFNGIFDGDGHTISNLCVNSNEQYQGLFGVTQNATIKNVNISSFFVSGSKYVGAIVGCTMGNDVIENCNTLKSVTNVACVVSTEGYTGGIVGAGFGTNPSVTKCTNNGLVFSNGGSVGGISGGAKVENCINKGNVKSITGGDFSDVGGIIGSGTATACENTGSVQGSMDNVGGIAGAGATVTECCNTGNVSGNYNVGGIGGKSCTISKCYTTSNVSGNSESTGVIQGYTTGSVSDSYCVYGSTLCTYNVCGKYSVGTQEASNIYSSSFDDMYSGKLAYELWKNYPDSQWGQAELGESKHPVPLTCNSDAKRVCKLTCYEEDGTTEYKSSYELLGTKVTLDSNINWVSVNGSTVENGVVTVDAVDTAVKMTRLSRKAPTGLGCQKAVDGVGAILNVSDEMEYSTSADGPYTACTGSTITGLAPGTYYVRYKENSIYFASEPAVVTIVEETAKYYEINVGDISFGKVEYGKSTTPQTIYISLAAGSDEAEITSVTTDNDVFIIDDSTVNGDNMVEKNTTNTVYKIETKSNLDAGTYTGNVIVKYNDGKEAKGGVSLEIEKAGQSAPTGITVMRTTSDAAQDGKLIGTTQDMEYTTEQSENAVYTQCSDGETTGLKAGKYYVRYREDKNHNPGNTILLEIPKPDEETYTLNVDEAVFGSIVYGTAGISKSLNIVSTGNSDSTIESVTVSGTAFTLDDSKKDTNVQAGGTNNTYIVKLSSGVNVGDYQETVTVMYNNGATATAKVTVSVEKAEQPQPSGITAKATSKAGAQDGSITGVDTSMEYSRTIDGTYVACTGSTIDNLAAGTYYIRYSQDANHNAGSPVKMIVPDGDEQIAVLSIEAVVFENVKEGYENDVSMNVKVSNTGNAKAIINSVKTSGNIFDITYGDNITVDAGKSDNSIIIRLAKGQKAGSYKEIITITYNDSSVAKAEISATVKPGDSEDVTKEDTTEEQETTKPQETTKEQITTTGQNTTTKESTTTGQNVTTKPQSTTTQQETTKEQETTKPQETTKEVETTKPQETTKEVETTKPQETTEEVETTTQQETTTPQETTKEQPVTTERETNGKEETTTAAKTQKISVAASTFNKKYGDKTFSLKAKTSGKGCRLTYSSSSKSIVTVSSKGVVKINGCGIAKITITAKGTGYKKATKTVTVKVSPKQEKLSSVTAKKRVVTINWKKDSKVSGYYVQYSTSPKFTKKTTKTVVVSKSAIVTKKITMKKKGKYYVRICGYKKSGKVKLLGKYSKVKVVTIK